MKDQDQARVILELLGYELQTRSDNTYWHPIHNHYFLSHELPNTLSKDVLWPLIQGMDDKLFETFLEILNRIVNKHSTNYEIVYSYDLVEATNNQLREAIIKAYGKWTS